LLKDTRPSAVAHLIENLSFDREINQPPFETWSKWQRKRLNNQSKYAIKFAGTGIRHYK
jgi:hypothetical protein